MRMEQNGAWKMAKITSTLKEIQQGRDHSHNIVLGRSLHKLPIETFFIAPILTDIVTEFSLEKIMQYYTYYH